MSGEGMSVGYIRSPVYRNKWDWVLYDETDRLVAYIQPPSDTWFRPRWYFYRGGREVQVPITPEKVLAMMVEYRLKGGFVG